MPKSKSKSRPRYSRAVMETFMSSSRSRPPSSSLSHVKQVTTRSNGVTRHRTRLLRSQRHVPFHCCLTLNHRDATSRPVRAANYNNDLLTLPVAIGADTAKSARVTTSQVDRTLPALPASQQAAESRIESSLRDTLPTCSTQLSASA